MSFIVRAGCFALILFGWMSCYCKCPLALPHGAVAWSEVCDCGIYLIVLTYFLVQVVFQSSTVTLRKLNFNVSYIFF